MQEYTLEGLPIVTKKTILYFRSDYNNSTNSVENNLAFIQDLFERMEYNQGLHELVEPRIDECIEVLEKILYDRSFGDIYACGNCLGLLTCHELILREAEILECEIPIVDTSTREIFLRDFNQRKKEGTLKSFQDKKIKYRENNPDLNKFIQKLTKKNDRYHAGVSAGMIFGYELMRIQAEVDSLENQFA